MSEIKVNIFDYVLEGYDDCTVLEDNKEYKTIEIDGQIDSDACESIKVVDGRENNSIIRSCDVIKGKIKKYKANDVPKEVPVIDRGSNIYFELHYGLNMVSSSDLINFININGAKKADVRTVDLNKISDNMKKLYHHDNIVEVTNRILEQLKNESPDARKTKNQTYIRWIKPEKGENIVLFGDLHGSFSTLVRHLLRFRKLNIINEKGIIRSGYKIIFLGDLVDRGVYSFETLMILYLLKLNNGDNLVINRGNHEEIETNEYYRLKDEFKHKLEHAEDIFRVVNEIMTWQPSAVILENPFDARECVYLAHGALPHDFDNNDKLAKDFVAGMKTKSSFIINENHGKSIRWNDIYGHYKTVDNMRRLNPTNDPRNNSKTNPMFKLIKVIGQNLVNEARGLGIKLIVRGHQDSFHNTKIIESDKNEWISIKNYTLKQDKKGVKCRGSIYGVSLIDDRMIIDNDMNTPFNLLPVLTISTNTDKDRNLTSDSYAILQFTEEEYVSKCFVGGRLF